LKYKKLILEKKERDQKIAGLTLERYQTSTLERKSIVGHFKTERLRVKNQFLLKYKKSEKILTLEMKPRAPCGAPSVWARAPCGAPSVWARAPCGAPSPSAGGTGGIFFYPQRNPSQKNSPCPPPPSRKKAKFFFYKIFISEKFFDISPYPFVKKIFAK